MKFKSRILIVFIILFIGTKGFTQDNLKNVEATSLNYKDKRYGIKDLNLLIYPSIKKVRDNLLSQSKSKKCKVYIKLKIKPSLKMLTKEKIQSDCKFQEQFDYKYFILNDLNIYVTSIDSNEEFVEMTIPIHIYKDNSPN